MRKRAQRRSKPTLDEPKRTIEQTKPKYEKKPSGIKKNWWIAVILICIFFMVLFLNTYFNFTSEIAINSDGEGLEKFYLSGPDPYYNMRLVQGTYETGMYPYYSDKDPLLNYPVGANGGRAPLFNMMAIGFSKVLSPFMDDVEALGYSMQFIPALFGALLIFPVFFIGREVFNKKAGLIGALFVAYIPIHLGSGHGSAYSLFDHDSFNLFLFFMTFLFLIKAVKEKDVLKSSLYAVLAGVPLAGLSMTWVEAQYLYVIIAIYAIVQMLFDIFRDKIEFRIFTSCSIILFSGYLISLPVIAVRGLGLSISLFICIAIGLFGFIYYLFGKKKIPWILSMPIIFGAGAIGLAFLYFTTSLVSSFKFLAPLVKLSEIVFGTGIYGQKVSLTIAEASTYQISHTIMSFGPALYWLGWAGFVFLIAYFYKNMNRRDYLFIVTLFITNIWLAGIAGRFLNDNVPLIATLSGWTVWMILDWIDYKQMIRNIKSAGGGFHGLRRGIKILHLFGFILIILILIIPNSFIAFDAAVPRQIVEDPDAGPDDPKYTSFKQLMFGDKHRGPFGLGVGKETYWADAFKWLSKQDTEIQDPADRPAFISWWDYGFYGVALGDHPVVADNFQDGIPTAANFHTADGEKAAVIILALRLMEAPIRENNNKVPDNLKQVLYNRLDEDDANDIISWMEIPTNSPSYGDLIDDEYNDVEDVEDFFVGQQYPRNAVYHDVIDRLNASYSDENITWLYHDIQKETGYSIRYYGVEGYDREIFNIFAFLSDKSLLLQTGTEDDYAKLSYQGYTLYSDGTKKADKTWSAKEIMDMDRAERNRIQITGSSQDRKDKYFDTMFYQTYIGPQFEEGKEYEGQVPTINMRHFYAEFLSDITRHPYLDTNRGAVVIAKYYEGAIVNGTIFYNGEKYTADQVAILKDLAFTKDITYPITHDKTTPEEGNFSLIAGAGNITVQIQRYSELDYGVPWSPYKPFPVKNITLQISEEQAFRLNDYEIDLGNITIQPGYLEGYSYIDENEDGIFNKSKESPLTNISIQLYEILGYGENTLELDQYNPIVLTVNETTGYYNVTDLEPGIYRINALKDGATVDVGDIKVYEGKNYYNFTEPKPADVKGQIYFDQNSNQMYDNGEELSNVDVEIHLARKDTQTGQTTPVKLVENTTTDANGIYEFNDLTPGWEVSEEGNINDYLIIATDQPKYRSEQDVLPLANKTTWANISIGYYPITYQGDAEYQGDGISEISIEFATDESIENNTGVTKIATTDENGSYSVELLPGTYNISAEKLEEETLVYSYTGSLIVDIRQDQEARSYDITLEKKSTKVQGYTKHDSNNIANITNIKFTPDFTVVNNTASVTRIVSSDENGYYSLELSPGTYTVNVSYDFNESGLNFTYIHSSTMVITTPATVKNYDIALTKEARD